MYPERTTSTRRLSSWGCEVSILGLQAIVPGLQLHHDTGSTPEDCKFCVTAYPRKQTQDLKL